MSDASSTEREAPRHSPREVTAVRQALRDSYANLHNVADYCEKNYMEASDKKKALQDTMSLVTQTLASVASHVGMVAREMLLILQEQSQILHQHENNVWNISQKLDIHVEKASRQKIGSLASRKKRLQAQKILTEGNQAPHPAYTRIPINFKSLDQTGHGITESDCQLSKTGTMSRRASSKSLANSQGTLGRSLRIIDPVLVPQIPEMTPPSTPPVWNSTSPLVDTTIMELLPPPPPVFPQESYPLLQGENHISKSISNFPDFISDLEFSDFPPPLASNDTVGIPSLTSVEAYDSLLDFFDPGLLPPPADEETNNTSWAADYEPQFPFYPESMEILPPPPPADI
ncbi:ABI gene family member 3 [Xenopus laevis]|uniref:ABI gene family member 3 n=2 Tax=Xenopus laevis TaxID=8355 RepID=A0A1L8ES77_XENLA|nr:ABI gene family member 3 [Xenopus laevis]XP_041432819.1 ABI gene family member 3 [Xenopus laevis]OCT62175.1 hypothetical protein XELAEV_18043259mg [Xenopus laevis]